MLMVEQSPFLQHLRPQLYRDPFPPFRRQSSRISCPFRTCQAWARNENNNNKRAQGIMVARDPLMQGEKRMRV